MARGFSRGGGGGGRSGGSGGGFSFGGGGGSRSSGGGFGFSFGSSSSSRRSNSYSSGGHHYHRRPRRPWHVPMFGRTVIISTRAQSFFSMFIVLIIFATAMCFFNARSVGFYTNEIKDQKALVQEYETRDKDFRKLIDNKEDYNTHLFDLTPYWNNIKGDFDYEQYSGNYDPTTPGIYDMDFYRDGQEYFFIVYEYPTLSGSGTTTDWTFAQYTKYQLKDLMTTGDNPGKLEIVYGYLTNTASKDDGVYAMNADYTLEKNQEYQYEVYHLDELKSQKNSNLMTALIFLAVDLLIVGGIVFFLVKKYKNAQRQADADLEKTQAETKLAQEQAKQINRTCDYCGASIPDGDDLCPGCGSRVFEDKD